MKVYIKILTKHDIHFPLSFKKLNLPKSDKNDKHVAMSEAADKGLTCALILTYREACFAGKKAIRSQTTLLPRIPAI